MIPVRPAPEPANFDKFVRQPGLDAISVLVGEKPKHKRRGPKRKKIAANREEIRPDAFPPFWRKVLPNMLTAYDHLCAYLSLYIEHATGSPSVDHVVPKSKKWDRVYEWTNYRLACALINSKKNNLDLALDPFCIAEGTFALELVAFQVVAGPTAKSSDLRDINGTIETLGLNLPECCNARGEYVTNYHAGDVTLQYVERRAPFVARELRRQGRLLRGDQ